MPCMLLTKIDRKLSNMLRLMQSVMWLLIMVGMDRTPRRDVRTNILVQDLVMKQSFM